MTAETRQVLRVSDLLATVKQALEMNFPALWVEGEISNFVAARSGHWYFTLKDNDAQLRCAMFRYQRRAQPQPANGQQVLLRGRLTVYPARGDLQMIVEFLEDAGDGALRRAFEALKLKLEAEGLFDPARKRPIPEAPRRIGVITSPSGAAIHDVLTTLRRRNPFSRVVLYPTLVQGAEAPAQLLRALRLAGQRRECDVILLTRGGGSLEDLQAFNDETVARAVAACPIPVVSAVGHEIDFTISDFVADRRAPTPTAAAEQVAPDSRQWTELMASSRHQLLTATQRGISHHAQLLKHARQRLDALAPQRRLQTQEQRVDDLTTRLVAAMRRRLHANGQALEQNRARLRSRQPGTRIQSYRISIQRGRDAAHHALRQRLGTAELRLRGATQRLEQLSPQRTLSRGYAIAWQDNHALRSPQQLTERHDFRLQLAEGTVDCVRSDDKAL